MNPYIITIKWMKMFKTLVKVKLMKMNKRVKKKQRKIY